MNVDKLTRENVASHLQVCVCERDRGYDSFYSLTWLPFNIMSSGFAEVSFRVEEDNK